MSEDNKQLEEQLENQAQNLREPDSINQENLGNSNQQFNDSVSSKTETTASEKTEQNAVPSELTGALSGSEEISAALAEQLGTSQQSQDLLSKVQLLIATLTQDNQALVQANENLKEQLEEQNGQIETTKRRYIGLAAEFDNFRKRTQREKEDFEKQAKRKTLNELLTVVDDFERARRLIQPANDGEMAIHKSYQGVYKKFVDSLKSLGVSAMRTEGQPFDPMYHEALLSEPTNEYPEGTILEELDRGYLLDDQVLRYAKVKVAAPGFESSEAEKTTEAISDG